MAPRALPSACRVSARPRFSARFPFATVSLEDKAVPLQVEITGWSPFEPGDADNSSLPVAALEYRFTNTTNQPLEAVFSFNAKNFMAVGQNAQRRPKHRPGGFMLWSAAPKEKGWEQGTFCATVSEPGAESEPRLVPRRLVGSAHDGLERHRQRRLLSNAPPITEGDPSPGATLFVPFKLARARSKKPFVLRLAWYVGETNLRLGKDPANRPTSPWPGNYKPWYAGRFAISHELAAYWRDNYASCARNPSASAIASTTRTLPPEVLEAVAANLTILKSPTVLRQADGKLWAWEGCSDNSGCCHGSCTHVWNYAQAIPASFPRLERTLRETEFGPSQDDRGHQMFRAGLPIRPVGPRLPRRRRRPARRHHEGLSRMAHQRRHRVAPQALAQGQGQPRLLHRHLGSRPQRLDRRTAPQHLRHRVLGTRRHVHQLLSRRA